MVHSCRSKDCLSSMGCCNWRYDLVGAPDVFQDMTSILTNYIVSWVRRSPFSEIIDRYTRTHRVDIQDNDSFGDLSHLSGHNLHVRTTWKHQRRRTYPPPSSLHRTRREIINLISVLQFPLPSRLHIDDRNNYPIKLHDAREMSEYQRAQSHSFPFVCWSDSQSTAA